MKQNTSQPAIAIGTSLEGGIFGGIINVNGQHKGVIWSPKHAGQISTILLPSRKMAEGDYSPSDCAANMRALLASGSPAARQVEAMDINGYKDWVIPSRDVLELGYRHFKPTNRQNYCSWRDGENLNSVPPGWLYTENMPAQTDIEAFRDNGEDAFDEAWYWSSTVLPSGKTAFSQDFGDGYQDYGLSYEGRVRAVSEIPL